MADFGTILNPLNKNLDLYCNSITTYNNNPTTQPFYIHSTWFSGTNNSGNNINNIPYTINYAGSNIVNTSTIVYLDETKTKIIFPVNSSLIGYYNIIVSGQQLTSDPTSFNTYSIQLKDGEDITNINQWRFPFPYTSSQLGTFYFNGQFKILDNNNEKELTIVSNTPLNCILGNMNVVITKFQ